jgi:ammonium transporter Rh
MGANADMLVNPFISLIIGFVAGVISVIGYQVFPNCIYKYLKLHDTCGVIYLHLIPGILGGGLSALVAGATPSAAFGNDLNSVFIKMGNGSTRTNSIQGGIQLATLCTTLAIGAVTGAITGGIL